MDAASIIAISIVSAVAVLLVGTGVYVIWLRRRADSAAATVSAVDLESSVPRSNTMPHPPSVEDLTYTRYA
jgi:flagellar basal body-associated protein FliL